MKTQGGCLCGRIRFEISGEPLHSIICHCKTCRVASAAPSVAWLTFERERVVVLAGAPRAFASSPGVVRTFCADCGTPLSYTSERDPKTIDITTLAMDDPERFPPSREMWLDHRLAWESPNASLTAYPRDRGRAGSSGCTPQ
ncbi:MAG: GFA family protein [Achromobacter sp.]